MRTLFFDSQTSAVQSGGEELVATWEGSETGILWLHIEGDITEDIRSLMGKSFGLHRLAIQDASRDRHPPKLEEFNNHTLIIFKPLTNETEDIDFSTVQTSFFIGERFLVTRSSGPCEIIDQLLDQEKETPRRLRKSPGHLACRLFRLFIDRYLEILLLLETTLDGVEDSLADSADDRLLLEVTGYKGNLKRLRRIFLYHEQLLRKLHANPTAGFSEELSHELNDVYEQQERANSLTLLYYELASDLIDGYLSLSSHRLNQIMKVLTVVTVIFVPLGFLAGIYGMNFEYMPELNNRAGYYILLSVMAGIVITLLTVFRMRRWL